MCRVPVPLPAGKWWVKIQMNDLDQKILEMKRGGGSLRRIALAVNLTHVAVLKRLRAIEEGGKVVTNGRVERLPQLNKEKRNLSNRYNPHIPSLSEDSDEGGNRVVTKKTPASDTGENVNPPPRPSRGPERGRKRLLRGFLRGFVWRVTICFQPFGRFLRREGSKCIG